VETHIGWLRERIQGLEPAIAGPVKHCEHWKEQQQRLNTVPGVGRVVANTLLALSPELGTLSHSQLAARVEVAPKIIAAPLLPCLRERFAHFAVRD
jgi:transposase